MPTAHEYRATAAALDALASESGALRSTMWRVGSDIGVRGGSYAEAIERGLDTVVLNVATVVTRCSEEADEALRRARVCDDYTADVRTYRSRAAAWDALDPDERFGPRPIRPMRPAAWAEEG